MFSQDHITKYPSLAKYANEDYTESHDGREAALLKYIYNHPSLPQFRNSPPAILAVIDEFAAQEDFLINIGSDKAAKVCDIIAQEQPSVFVELGGLEFDPVIADIARNLIDLAGLSDIVTVVVGSAANSLRKLHSEGTLDYMDLLFLDHVEDLYLSDFQVCESLGLLRSGALVVADNVLRPGAPQYREFMRGYNKVESWAVKGLIIPGELEDELEVPRIK
ncbi:S-adenosyl-L-methionine-dependent methyltransferase [Penicillium manginii]|uniref:S-adenosyl-L-methionine-dependent methyltransferase n=1 Tax=Penicillium manginii TaxID=203109 RepID=UPI00254791C6|nr:S-adenosyl-L-methionine-dependent methyltransferase [Penicillium manginii]KAJ5732969.1 S-adenosyl-L-methionine-dependent methyltransferase [Penicillium manginii]